MNLIYLIGAFQSGISLLVMSVSNPIHSILFLIIVFVLGTILLFFLHLEYYARLFLIVYVGAIVVLFLFIIRRLELKIVNIVIQLNDMITFRYWIIGIYIYVVLSRISNDFFDRKYFIDYYKIYDNNSNYLESINYLNWVKIIQHIGQLQALGGILFTEYRISILLASILLFLSRVAALALTLSVTSSITANNVSKVFLVKEILLSKSQDVSYQLLRNPNNILKIF